MVDLSVLSKVVVRSASNSHRARTTVASVVLFCCLDSMVVIYRASRTPDTCL